MMPPVAPPQDVEAEEAVLGGALLAGDEALRLAVAAGLAPEHFYREQYGRIFAAMLRLLGRGAGVDALSVRAALAEAGALEVVGGAAALGLLAAAVPMLGNVSEYARVVVARAVERER